MAYFTEDSIDQFALRSYIIRQIELNSAIPPKIKDIVDKVFSDQFLLYMMLASDRNLAKTTYQLFSPIAPVSVMIDAIVEKLGGTRLSKAFLSSKKKDDAEKLYDIAVEALGYLYTPNDLMIYCEIHADAVAEAVKESQARVEKSSAKKSRKSKL